MRLINKLLLPSLLALSLVSVTTLAGDAPAPYKEGINYIPVMPAQPISVNPGQVEVLEFSGTAIRSVSPWSRTWPRGKRASRPTWC